MQLKWFLNEVKQQNQLPLVRSYLKLYKSITVSKLAKFCNLSEEKVLTQLVAMNTKAYQKTHTNPGTKHSILFFFFIIKNNILIVFCYHFVGTPPMEGSYSSVTDLKYFVYGDMIHISEARAARRYGEYFMNHTLKLQRVIEDLETKTHGKGYHKNKGHHQKHRHQKH